MTRFRHKHGGLYEVLMRRKSPYTAHAGEYIPMQLRGKTIWATVTDPLVGQDMPVVVYRNVTTGKCFIRPAEIFDEPGRFVSVPEAPAAPQPKLMYAVTLFSDEDEDFLESPLGVTDDAARAHALGQRIDALIRKYDVAGFPPLLGSDADAADAMNAFRADLSAELLACGLPDAHVGYFNVAVEVKAYAAF